MEKTTRTNPVEKFIIFNADIMIVDHLNDNDHNNNNIFIIISTKPITMTHSITKTTATPTSTIAVEHNDE